MNTFAFDVVDIMNTAGLSYLFQDKLHCIDTVFRLCKTNYLLSWLHILHVSVMSSVWFLFQTYVAPLLSLSLFLPV